MRHRVRTAALAVALVLAGSSRADLKQALGEPNLEKRSQLALDNARTAYKAARAAYDKGENDQTAAAIHEMEESVDLAYASLTKTGKDPRKSPKYFKKAEIDTRELMKHIDAFENSMSFSDRAMLEKLKAKVQQVHDDLLVGLMEGKRK
jgi:hypothetical protein